MGEVKQGATLEAVRGGVARPTVVLGRGLAEPTNMETKRTQVETVTEEHDPTRGQIVGALER